MSTYLCYNCLKYILVDILSRIPQLICYMMIHSDSECYSCWHSHSQSFHHHILCKKKSFVLNYIRCLLFGHTFLFWFHVCFLQRKKMLKVVKKGQSKCINSFNKIIKYVEGQNNFSLCNTILIIVKIIVFEIKF